VARELSSDFGKRRVGFGHSAQYADGVPHRRGLGEQADSICRTGVRLSRFSAPILPMRCNTLIFSPVRLGLRCRKDFCLGSRGSLNCSHVQRGQTFWCCSQASSWRQVGEPSRRRCASWDANAIPTSVYPVHVMTRKSFGLMTRKLSVTESQRSAQFRGTVSRRKPSVASANWAQVA
jgi:hypothetical protein